MMLCDVIRGFLPHATRALFRSIQIDDVEVPFDHQLPECIAIKCTFDPVVVHRLVCTKILSRPITIRIDLTWRISDVAAFLAAEAAILPSTVTIWACDKQCHHQAFAIEFPTAIFHARLTATTHALTVAQPKNDAPMDIPKDEAMKHPKPGTVAIAFAEPQWKKIRVICMDKAETVGNMKERLFPGSTKTLFYHDGSPIPEDETIDKLTLRKGDIDILFDYRHPMPCTTLAFAYPFQFPDDNCDSKIEIQDPFSVHTTFMYVPHAASLTEVAARVVASFSADISLQITQNGKLMDPRVAVHHCSEHTFRFRATGLPGGAKPNEDVTRALEAALTARGVPMESVQARIAVIMNKIPAKDIRPDIHLDGDAFWSRLKHMANEAKIRLITTQELKEHQKKVRTEKKHSNIAPVPKPKATNGSNIKPTLKASELSIDVAHFEASKVTPAAIDFAKFGPDATGIAVASMEEANKMLPVSSLSADPLALIVITDREFAGHQPTTIPAHHKDGTPILLSVVILNFGDIPIMFKPQVPMTSITEVASTVLEINVIRKYVAVWGDVHSRMTFLGTHLPELRQGQVIATWQMHFFDEQRNKTGHQSAHHLHGFVRVASTLVDATLVRSGAAGIFIAPKDAQKKHHPNYAIIQMPGTDLEEAVALAKKHKTALGVVQLSKTFAIRCRRTDLATLRPTLLPGSICPQEGEIHQDATLWMIKHLLTSTTCQDLTTALKSIGWQASVVKPVNNTTWIVSAQTPPPSAHIAINNAFVAIVQAKKSDDRSTLAAFTTIHKNASVKVIGEPSFTSEDDDMVSEPSTSTTRFSDLQKNLEQQINTMIESKMQATDQRLNKLETTMSETKQEMTGMKDHISVGNNAVMQQMQSLFGQLQTSMCGRLESLEKEVAADDRSRRTDLATLRPTLLPGSICPQEGEIHQDATLWMIKHLLTSTTCQDLTTALKSIGWQASVVKPLNNTTWIVSAQTPPPSAHIAINNAFVAIVQAKKSDDRSTLAAFTTIHKNASVKVIGEPSFTSEDDDMVSEPSTSTTRFSDLQKNLEQKINTMIESKMQATDQRLNKLETTMSETKQEMTGMKDHISVANNAVMQQMQSLFGQLQTSMCGRLESLEKEVAADDRSRSRHRDS
eukprot:symbB.v1.2.008545.t1/scaffold538.1/size242405/12